MTGEHFLVRCSIHFSPVLNLYSQQRPWPNIVPNHSLLSYTLRSQRGSRRWNRNRPGSHWRFRFFFHSTCEMRSLIKLLGLRHQPYCGERWHYGDLRYLRRRTSEDRDTTRRLVGVLGPERTTAVHARLWIRRRTKEAPEWIDWFTCQSCPILVGLQFGEIPR